MGNPFNIISYNFIYLKNILSLFIIIAAFKLQNILLSAGSHSKRGLLSPVHLKLARFNVCLEGMEKNNIYDSYHNFINLAVQPIFEHTVIDKIKGLEDTTKFFLLLEYYFKIKMNIESDIKNFEWDLRKDNNIFSLEEFIKFYEIESKNIINKKQ